MKKIFMFASTLLFCSASFADYVIVNPNINYTLPGNPIIFTYRQLDGHIGFSHCYPQILDYDAVNNIVTYGCNFETDPHVFIPYARFVNIP